MILLLCWKHSHGLCLSPFHRQLFPEKRTGAESRNRKPHHLLCRRLPWTPSVPFLFIVQEASRKHSEASLSFPGHPTLLLCQTHRLLRRLEQGFPEASTEGGMLPVPLPDRKVLLWVEICFLENPPLTFTFSPENPSLLWKKAQNLGSKLVSATDLKLQLF